MSARDPLAAFRRRWQRARATLQACVEEAMANRNECEAAGDTAGLAQWDAILREESVVMVTLPPETDLPALLNRLGHVEARLEGIEAVCAGMEVEA